MYDWLIVGGGLHGTFAAQAITAAAPAARLAVLDDRHPLADWQRRADACGMIYLRSSNAHHLGRRADALRAFAAENGFDSGHELGYYRRPARALFEAHARHALAGPERIATRGERIERLARGWRVHATNGRAYDTRRLVLALGPNAPYRPVAAAGCEHVYDADFAIDRYASARVAVVGGGITGAQLALKLQELGHTVCWVTRTPPRRADFDSDPCYAGPRCLTPFARTPIEARTALLANARQPGTLPPDVLARITAALAAGDIAWRRGDVESTDANGLVLAHGRRIDADRVILATGFENHARPDSLLGHTIDALDLRCDSDGHVFINDNLEAAPGLHLLGRPASLQLGPMAGNIKGARLAGTRLAALAKRGARNAA
ncbi:FAD-dependent oxidoreductase [Salinisphaera sp.]|uniref:FAD-dependent oxidoreductase n=1 Tax=Salinisphaera sp. TaxID=1914330 RepID=UPI000C41B469|nr:FAD-dependent oxidoreductase [Salinisphaera sp.]MBS62304.1 hypothetical protein [Salinisphaera sp.]